MRSAALTGCPYMQKHGQPKGSCADGPAYMQNSSRYVEIFTSNKEELERRIVSGTIVL